MNDATRVRLLYAQIPAKPLHRPTLSKTLLTEQWHPAKTLLTEQWHPAKTLLTEQWHPEFQKK
jgi:hypothetical protein